jgi:hypothetical protein
MWFKKHFQANTCSNDDYCQNQDNCVFDFHELVFY